MSIPQWISAVFAALLAGWHRRPPWRRPRPRPQRRSSPCSRCSPRRVDESVTTPPGTGAKIGAGVLNVVYLPGKAIICSAGTLVAGVFMLATFGTAYREATSFFNEGCGGAWLLTPEQVAAVPKKVQLQY